MIPRYELSINPEFAEDGEELGIFQIANTENPAIMLKGVAFNAHKKSVYFADDLKYRIAAPVLTPMDVYRKDEKTGEEYYAVVTTEYIEQVFVDFMAKRTGGVVFNDEHDESKEVPAYILETWLVENPETDKSKTVYGLDVPQGSWFAVQQFTDKQVYKQFVKEGKTGFSIHGHSAMLLMSGLKFEETYNDYPESASNNAQKVLDWRDEHGDEVKGMTRVGWTRANQLAKGEKISRDTIARMASFKRHEKNAEVSKENESTPWKDAGRVAWLGWGGASGINWAIKKLESINNTTMANEKKEVEMNADGKPSAYLELPVGTHEIAGSIYTVEEVVENEGTENEYRCNKIVSIVPVEGGEATEMGEDKKEEETEMSNNVEMNEDKEDKDEETEDTEMAKEEETEMAEHEDEKKKEETEMQEEGEEIAYYSKEEVDAKFAELYDMIAELKTSGEAEEAEEEASVQMSEQPKGRIQSISEKLNKFRAVGTK